MQFPGDAGPMELNSILNGVMEVYPVGIVLCDQLGNILLANRELERMFGYAPAELVGQAIEVLVPGNLRARHTRHRLQFTASSDVRMARDRRLSGRRKDGDEFPVEVGLNPIRTNDGIHVLGVIVDISERIRIEHMKDEFVATVSHELRTPLTSIGGALGLLVGNAGGELPRSALRLLTIAYANSQRLMRLVESILTMEKLESGKLVFALKRLDVRSLVGQAIEANQAFADTYKVRIILDPSSTTGEIHADSDWVLQIATNLLSNAIKFSPPGSDVTVAVKERSGSVGITVRDHGPGIPDEFKPHIFEKFAQANATDARRQGGTGLGLSIVKQIVTRLGGQVHFSDAPGGGAIFSVELPACDSEGAATAASAPEQHVPGPLKNTEGALQ